MKKQLTEWEAWDVIAADFLRRKPSRSALCAAVTSLASAGRISADTEERMTARVAAYMGRKAGGYAYTQPGARMEWSSNVAPGLFGRNDDSRDARDARAMAAYWMAMDAAWEASGQAIVDFRLATARHGAVLPRPAR